MRGRMLWALSLAACMCGTSPTAVPAAGPGIPAVKATVATYPDKASEDPAIAAHTLSLDRARPLPTEWHIKQYNTASPRQATDATATLVYRNTEGTLYWVPGADVLIADDIQTIAAEGCDISYYEVLVYDGGDGGGPGYTVTMALYDACPGAGGQVIEGTEATVALPSDGPWLVRHSPQGQEVPIPNGLWLGLSFSTDDAGWVVGEPAQVGFSEDNYDAPQFPCNAWFGGYPDFPHASFYCEIYCTSESVPRFVGYLADAYHGAVWPGSGCIDGGELDGCGDGVNVYHTCESGADDIYPVIDDCMLASYEVGVGALAGAGPFDIEFELWTDAGGNPSEPIPGTTCCYHAVGDGGPPETAVCPSDGPVQLPPAFWLVYQHDQSTYEGGLAIAHDWPSIGFSDDCWAIWGDSDPEQWSGCEWGWPGGCDMGICGTFLLKLWCIGGGCPSGTVNFIDPPDGVVDARQPHPVDSKTPLQGIDTIDVQAPSGACPSCWSLCETDSGYFEEHVPGNAITHVTEISDGRYTISLRRPIMPGAVATLTYTPDTGPPVTASFISHPANVNGDNQTSPSDILDVIDYINGIATPPWAVYSTDIDNNGEFSPSDITRLIDLLTGEGEFDPWNGTPLPVNHGSCP